MSTEEQADELISDCYRFLDKDSIAEREAEDEAYEQEFFEMEVNRFGTLYVYAAEDFGELTLCFPSAFQQQCSRIRSECGLRSVHKPQRLDVSSFESLYLDHADEAFEWQEPLPDEHLLALLGLFRGALMQKQGVHGEATRAECGFDRLDLPD